MTKFEIRCPYCNAILESDSNLVGKVSICPSCKSDIFVEKLFKDVALKFKCVHCFYDLEVLSSMIGRNIVCPICGGDVYVSNPNSSGEKEEKEIVKSDVIQDLIINSKNKQYIPKSKKSISAQEQILSRLHPSFFYYYFNCFYYFCGVNFLIFSFFMMFYFSCCYFNSPNFYPVDCKFNCILLTLEFSAKDVEEYKRNISYRISWFLILFCLTGSFVLVGEKTRRRTLYMISNRRVVLLSRGIFKYEKEIDLYDVKNIYMIQGPFAQLFDYATITMSSNGSGRDFGQIKFKGIQNPDQIRSILKTYKDLSKLKTRGE